MRVGTTPAIHVRARGVSSSSPGARVPAAPRVRRLSTGWAAAASASTSGEVAWGVRSDKARNWKRTLDQYKQLAAEEAARGPGSAAAAAAASATTAQVSKAEAEAAAAAVAEKHLQDFRTLVLDVSYSPIDVINWRRAITLDHLAKVEVLQYYDRNVRSAVDVHPLPAVVKVQMYVKAKQHATARVMVSRRNVLLRDDYTCQYCGCRGSNTSLTIDHVMPLSRGGGFTWQNLVAACAPCNSKKANRTPTEANMPLRSKPKVPNVLKVTTFKESSIRREAPPEEWQPFVPCGLCEEDDETAAL